MAVKCLAIILKKVQPSQIASICKKLGKLILEGSDSLRDIYAIGLKTLIADVPDETGTLVTQQLTGSLVTGIANAGNDEVSRECLDIMTDLLRRFGHLNEQNHFNIMTTVMARLDCSKVVIRKRATNCLSSLAVASSEAVMDHMVTVLLEKIETKAQHSEASAQTRTYIQTIGSISRTVGHRLGKYVERIIPLFLKFCGSPNDENLQNDSYNELRESCFPGVESFVLRCHKEVGAFVHDILRTSLQFAKYDPNYQYEEDEHTDMDIDGEDEDEMQDDDYDQDDFAASDDDDSSWKVRKAAVKVVSAVITTRPEMVEELFRLCADELISRFKEREENVRLDIIACFNCLVLAVHSQAKARSAALLQSKLSYVVSSVVTQLAGPSTKTKSAVLVVLKSFSIALKVCCC